MKNTPTEIQNLYVTTKNGNTLSFFYNPSTNLLVVDLIGRDGGNEIVRMTLNEKKLLNHLNS